MSQEWNFLSNFRNPNSLPHSPLLLAGKNCELDINECESNPCKYDGVCLERSNVTLYRAADAPPLQVGPQPHQLLPPAFYQPFSLDTAAG